MLHKKPGLPPQKKELKAHDLGEWKHRSFSLNSKRSKGRFARKSSYLGLFSENAPELREALPDSFPVVQALPKAMNPGTSNPAKHLPSCHPKAKGRMAKCYNGWDLGMTPKFYSFLRTKAQNPITKGNLTLGLT